MYVCPENDDEEVNGRTKGAALWESTVLPKRS